MASRIINKGVHCKIRVHGNGLIAGTNYTAVLYSNPNKTEGRASVTAEAEAIEEVDNGTTTQEVSCLFDFTPDDTVNLIRGNAILEVYDTESKEQMMHDDNYATVRSTSLSN